MVKSLKEKHAQMMPKKDLKSPKEKDKIKEKSVKDIKEKEKDDKFKEKDAKEKQIKEKEQKAKLKEKEKHKIKDKSKESKKEKGKEGKHKKTGSDMKKLKGGGRTRSAKAGLFFPVGRIHRCLKERVPRHTRVGATAAIYIAAVMEYVIAEVLELSGNQAKQLKKRRITPRNLLMAIKSDQELDQLIKGTIISGGGVVPFVHEVLKKNKTAPSTPTAG
uniref:Histone H2A n=1 Tax=Hematodinium sp. SG-2012 TaxID=1263730 RepID=K9NV96_9DINO|nr:histone H2A.1 [Hematodinium sp. SG-2012]|eukprot:GEMP01095711.1.p1 GENE.GEMP01095711.1~~GEMP01095711.1.p1  ORF type:complete len:218 (+),score=73.32 GEMP01095711.1:112-765(+)